MHFYILRWIANGISICTAIYIILWITMMTLHHRNFTCNSNKEEIVENDVFHIISHRGVRTFGEENTLNAIIGAVERIPHYTGVEVDIQLTRDHVPFLMHDTSLERITGDKRCVDEIDAVDLPYLKTKQLRQNIPTLFTALKLLDREMKFQTENKKFVTNNQFLVFLDVKSTHPDIIQIVNTTIMSAKPLYYLDILVNFPNFIMSNQKGQTENPSLVDSSLYTFVSHNGRCGTMTSENWLHFLFWPLPNALVWVVNQPFAFKIFQMLGAHGIMTDLNL